MRDRSQLYRCDDSLVHAVPRRGDPVFIDESSAATVSRGEPKEARPTDRHLQDKEGTHNGAIFLLLLTFLLCTFTVLLCTFGPADATQKLSL